MTHRESVSRHMATTALLALVPAAAAQTLTVEELAAGGTARFDVSGAGPGELAVLALGFAGLGPGLCLDSATCLDLVGLPTVLATASVGADGAVAFVLPIASTVPAVPVAAQAVLVASGPAGLTFTLTPAIDGAIATIDALSDDFEVPVLGPAWSILHSTLGSVVVEGGELVLAPSVGGLPDMWFQNGEGLFVYRSVTGDFDLSTEIRVHAPGDPTSPPAAGFRLGGLLLRDPGATSAGEHVWCHIATGSGGAGLSSGVEWKQTTDSVSTWAIDPAPDTYRELRLMRSGDQVTVWQRDPGAAGWLLVRSFAFPGLPTTVQVGAMAYSNANPAQVVARFEHLTFAP